MSRSVLQSELSAGRGGSCCCWAPRTLHAFLGRGLGDAGGSHCRAVLGRPFPQHHPSGSRSVPPPPSSWLRWDVGMLASWCLSTAHQPTMLGTPRSPTPLGVPVRSIPPPHSGFEAAPQPLSGKSQSTSHCPELILGSAWGGGLQPLPSVLFSFWVLPTPLVEALIGPCSHCPHSAQTPRELPNTPKAALCTGWGAHKEWL